MGPAQAPGARAERCISLGLMFVLSLFSERSGQERWVAPYWVLSRDEEIGQDILFVLSIVNEQWFESNDDRLGIATQKR